MGIMPSNDLGDDFIPDLEATRVAGQINSMNITIMYSTHALKKITFTVLRKYI